MKTPSACRQAEEQAGLMKSSNDHVMSLYLVNLNKLLKQFICYIVAGFIFIATVELYILTL